MPAELQHDMQRLSSQIQTCKQARAYIMDQVLTRRDPWFGDENNTTITKNTKIKLTTAQISKIECTKTNRVHTEQGKTPQTSNVQAGK